MLQICYKIPVMRYFRPVIAIGGLLILFSAALRCEEPAQVTVCELKANPADYNHKLIEVIGFVSHGFEDFGLFDPSCSSWPYVWLEYGGTKKSGTMYCCGVSNEQDSSSGTRGGRNYGFAYNRRNVRHVRQAHPAGFSGSRNTYRTVFCRQRISAHGPRLRAHGVL